MTYYRKEYRMLIMNKVTQIRPTEKFVWMKKLKSGKYAWFKTIYGVRLKRNGEIETDWYDNDLEAEIQLAVLYKNRDRKV